MSSCSTKIFIQTTCSPDMEIRLRHLVEENDLRSSLTSFYDAVLRTESARILSDVRSGMEVRVEGNPTQTGGFKRFVEWIDEIYGFAKNDRVFEDSILKPFRLASACYVNAKGGINVRGMIFSKSEEYFDSSWGVDQRTISIVSPDLRAPFSIRIRSEDANEFGYGFYEFRNVKPVLLTNRLHQYRGREIKRLDIEDGFEEWDFLNVAMDDLNHFDCSIEVEHYCEVPIYNDPRHRLLGAVLTISGQVTSVSGVMMTIKSVTSGNEYQFQISGELLDTDIGHLEGEHVKALITHWYHEVPYDASTHRESDLFMLRNITREAAIIHDIVGHVRIRKTEPVEKLRDVFGNDVKLEDIQAIEVHGGQASMRGISKSDEDVGEYLDTMRHIRSLRAKDTEIEGPLHTPEDVFDPEKISEKYLARDGHVVAMLLNLIKADDFGTTPEEDSYTGNRVWKRKQNMLIKLGCIKKADVMTATASGIAIAYEGTKDEISRTIRDRDVVFIPEMENRITPTLLYRHLEKNGYQKVDYKDTKFDLMWKKPTASKAAEYEGWIEEICAPVLRMMAKKTHSLHFNKIKETLENSNEIRLSTYSLWKIMQFLVNSKSVSSNGKNYNICTEERVLLFLKDHKNSFYTLDNICKHVKIPRIHKPNTPAGITKEEKMLEIKEVLLDLKKKNKIEELVMGYWQACSNQDTPEGRRNRILGSMIRKEILSMLRGKSMQKQMLIGRIDHIIRTKYSGGRISNPHELAEKYIQQLFDAKVLNGESGRIRLVSDL